MGQTVVKLSKPYTVHETTFSEIALREPTYREIFMEGMGHPVEWQGTPAAPMMVTYPDVVDGYVRKLIVSPGYEMITGLSSVDALKLERAVCNFFLEWRQSSSTPES
ncbi:phage tail assembly protein [Rhizobium tumorigenes]|uniref:phage tail assembly protein n=1 Tax=Rhizobium tumorigenes TaxID=2041385 RepID=UPI00241EA5E2|nr:phage tail assembly protein [Rhizobium tumorigenes]WFS01592.1 phage tail assembly protein [Rhizobium tumorigenes]